MKLIIAGGRDYVFTDGDFSTLDGIHSLIPVTEVVSGGARGADSYGEMWAGRHGLRVKRFIADWDRYKNAAGAIRNEQMAQYAEALAVFPGNNGTANMIEQAAKYRLRIFECGGFIKYHQDKHQMDMLIDPDWMRERLEEEEGSIEAGITPIQRRLTCCYCKMPLSDNQLVKDAYKLNTVNTWAKQQLNILADIAADRGLTWFSDHVRKITEQMGSL